MTVTQTEACPTVLKTHWNASCSYLLLPICGCDWQLLTRRKDFHCRDEKAWLQGSSLNAPGARLLLHLHSRLRGPCRGPVMLSENLYCESEAVVTCLCCTRIHVQHVYVYMYTNVFGARCGHIIMDFYIRTYLHYSYFSRVYRIHKVCCTLSTHFTSSHIQ